jgi:hypothetical protein
MAYPTKGKTLCETGRCQQSCTTKTRLADKINALVRMKENTLAYKGKQNGVTKGKIFSSRENQGQKTPQTFRLNKARPLWEQ